LLDIDYNAAEVRVFLALGGVKQPTSDIHEWNMDKFGYSTRTLAKNDFISWLYGKKNDREAEFRKYYNADKIKSKYWDGNSVTNYYGRNIQADDFHAINYMVQSTTADMALRQVLKINEILKGYESKIKMVIHDNIVIDMKKEEKHLIKSIVDTYNNTDFGKFKSSIRIGKNLGNMRNIL
jgi:DNA polymerase I-like protein with 3'-5' exonuclease and polymerase domains